ncbi:S3 self-incompatibility locus-linked pollen [Olea europaea subsp. europaea]|uniref:S3 self-incompatibility locus-linked pollen n=1 Tax=Olea europaea subsp. europaea TaxID=158383 RepID=A0A8S0V7U2_OLEEU|nr:S3 self-incompatibility locus-linked pollen [Olea europaea subsp. europaea]
MDPEQTFIRVQERFSEMLSPKIRVTLEYLFLFLAITLFCILVVMHANYVQQPGCSSELSEAEMSEAQLIQIKITSAGLWSQNDPRYDATDAHKREAGNAISKATNEDGDGLPLFGKKSWLTWISSGARRWKSPLKFSSTENDVLESQEEACVSSESCKAAADVVVLKTNKDGSRGRFFISPKESLKAAIVHIFRKWHGRISFIWRLAKRILGGLWDIAGINLNFDIPKWIKILHLDRLNSYAVKWLEKRSKAFEPAYLYTMEKGYFLLPEEARSRHNIRTINISISARHTCFGNRWQQLLINRLVGYDTILMNSLLNSPGQGYLYNYQTKEFYNLTYAHEQPESYAKFGDYLVTKCGVLMMSLFVFFTTTMSVSFTLRETQTRMLKFTGCMDLNVEGKEMVSKVINSSGNPANTTVSYLFLLRDVKDGFLVYVRTPISMKFFPRFFLLYFLVFHIYFFSYTHGFSYLALSAAAAFMQHLILYFWNRFEVPALQRFMQNRRSHFQQHPDFHITSSTILASTLHITRLNTRNPGLLNTDLASGPAIRTGTNTGMPRNGATAFPGPQEQPSNDNPERLGNPLEIGGQPALRQPETGSNPGAMNSFSSLLLWILGGASSESLNSFLSMFRDLREHGQVYTEPPRQENRTEPHDE